PVEGLRELTPRPPDVVILGLGLPGMDGMEVLRMLRAVHDVPVIVASARDHDGDVVAALDRGADDYVIKPFSGAPLDARIRAVLRRAGSDGPSGPIVVGDLVVNPRTREAHLEGRALDLNRKEFDVLSYLALRQGDVVSKRDLQRDVWHQPE